MVCNNLLSHKIDKIGTQRAMLLPVARRQVYDIKRSIHHVMRIACYNLYVSCSSPMKTQHTNDFYRTVSTTYIKVACISRLPYL